jgi:hypothetical protein
MEDARLRTVSTNPNEESIRSSGKTPSSNILSSTKRRIKSLSTKLVGQSVLYHTSLTNKHFRLLQLLPTEDPRMPVRCKLLQYRLSRGLPYEAISYVWGDAAVSQMEIFCNDQRVLVTCNLHAGLIRLRLAGTIRILWVDALCINQADDREKSWQVPLMGDIFSGAERVIAWLGLTESTTADTSLKAIDCIIEAIGPSPTKARAYVDAIAGGRRPLSDLDIDFSDTVWKSFEILFSNPFFERIWYDQRLHGLNLQHANFSGVYRR